MPQLRKNPIFDTWVIISEERALRPNDFSNVTPSDCPFCYSSLLNIWKGPS